MEEENDITLEFSCNIEELIYQCMQAGRHFHVDMLPISGVQWGVASCLLEAYLELKGHLLPKNAILLVSRKRLRAVAPADENVLKKAGVGTEKDYWDQFCPGHDGQTKFLTDSRREYAVLALETVKEFPNLAKSDAKYQNEPLIRPWGYYLHNLPRCMWIKVNDH